MYVKYETCFLSDIILGKIAMSEFQLFQYCSSGLWMNRIVSFSFISQPTCSWWSSLLSTFTENRSPKRNPGQHFRDGLGQEGSRHTWTSRGHTYVWPEVYLPVRSLSTPVLSCIFSPFCGCLSSDSPTLPGTLANICLNLNYGVKGSWAPGLPGGPFLCPWMTTLQVGNQK